MTILIKNTASNPTVDYAASELAYYLEKMTKAEVGFSTDEADIVLKLVADDEENDHAQYQLQDNQVIIAGNRPVAVLIASYQYLHALGARFLRPGRENELIPNIEVEEIKQIKAYDHVASYKHRGVCIEGANSLENILEFIEWLPKNGFNSFFIQFANPYTFLKRWYSHEFNHYLEGRDLSDAEIQTMSDEIDEAMALRDLRHHRVGHGWTGEVLGYSSEFGWESGVELAEDKRDLVAKVNGKRDLIQGTPIFTNLDMSNHKVNEEMAKVIVDYAAKHKEVDYLHVWLSDGDNNVCECDECQKILPADQYVNFLNYLDEKLTEAGLDTKICFLLYHELLFAPEESKIKNPERFVLMFAPISRTFEKSYADVDYEHGIPEPTPYVRNKTTLPNSLEENLAFLFDWQKNFKGDSFVYDYPLDRAHYGDLGYMEISQIISRDIRYLDKLHLNGYISCQELRTGFPTTLPNYVMGRTLWDKSLTYEELEKEYFTAAFGKEGMTVAAYLEKLSNLSSSDYFNKIGSRINAQLAAQYQGCVSEAVAILLVVIKGLKDSQASQHENWRVLAYHRQAVIKLATALGLQASGKQAKAEEAWIDFQDFIKLHEANFEPYLDVYRIIEVATNYAGFKYRE